MTTHYLIIRDADTNATLFMVEFDSLDKKESFRTKLRRRVAEYKDDSFSRDMAVRDLALDLTALAECMSGDINGLWDFREPCPWDDEFFDV